MKPFFEKLKSRAGESLIESMIAILIFTLSSIVMYSMVTAAGDINATAKSRDLETQQQMAAAEKGEGAGTAGQVSVSIVLGGSSAVISTEDVEIYGDPENTLYSYYAVQEQEAGDE